MKYAVEERTPTQQVEGIGLTFSGGSFLAQQRQEGPRLSRAIRLRRTGGRRLRLLIGVFLNQGIWKSKGTFTSVAIDEQTCARS